MGRLSLTALAARPLVCALPKESLVLSSIALRSQLSQLYSTSIAVSPSQDLPSRPNFIAIDKKWRQYLNNPKSPSRKGKKFYILSMFPYPSGILHMGHLRVYTISDVLARFERMRGCEVIHPMGWDAFGLPAENAAIERGIGAREWTENNIEKMKKQFGLMGVGFDWDREIKTCSPEYYVHTQRLFLDLYRHGLAYRAESVVNWDPIDKTVLANEQVSPDGLSWRSGALVEKISLKQWFFKITAYRDALLKDLKVLEHGWPLNVRRMQVNWIGESKGAIVRFPLSTESPTFAGFDTLEVFTTRLDTLHGVQFLAVSTSHPLAVKAAEAEPRLQKFLQQNMNADERSKKGFRIDNITARNPLSDESIPIYVASYVIGKYGTGAVMGVPGHDPRDKAFWTKRSPNGSTIKVVIEPDPGNPRPRPGPPPADVFQDLGILNNNCGEYSGMTSRHAQCAILAKLSQAGQAAPSEQLKLKDWLVSRQRYWGTPIPMIHCADCGPVPVKDEDLPVVLPEIAKLSSKGGNPLAGVKEWVETTCPECGKEAKRETDTMDTFVDSSWYFIRYADPHNRKLAFSPELADSLLPVDVYVGGVEHAILHLLYSRFIAKFMHSSGKWPSGGGPDNRAEPFKRLITQGMVLGKTYKHPKTQRYLKPEELEFGPDAKSLSVMSDNERPLILWEKMSKSKFNGTDPQKCIEEWGSDATRAHMLFQGRVEDELQWDEERIIGVQRWFEKLWKHVNSLAPQLADPGFLILPTRDLHNIPIDRVAEEDKILFGTLQTTIREVSYNLSKSITLNTVVSSLIKLTNQLVSARRSIPGEPPGTGRQPFSLEMNYSATNALLRMLSPVAPGFSEECWELLHQRVPQMARTRALESTWPWFTYQEGEEFGGMATTCAVQVNGKLRMGKLEIDRKKLLQNDTKLAEKYLLRTVKKAEPIKKWLAGRKIKKVFIAGNGKVVNLVMDN